MDNASCKRYDTVVVRRHNFSFAGQLRPGRCGIAEIYEHWRKDNENEPPSRRRRFNIIFIKSVAQLYL